MKAVILDTETTGFEEPEAIEIACQGIEDLGLRVVETFEQRYRPTKPIDWGAIATHHIMPEELTNCPPTNTYKLPDQIEYIIGHNIDFDWEVLGKPNVKRICTLALARELLPNLDSHTQSALLYFFEGIDARDKLRNAHSALPDVENCRLVLGYLLELLVQKFPQLAVSPLTFEELWGISEQARIPKKMPFGKHKGELIKNIPGGYKKWLLAQPDVDVYLVKALHDKV